MGMYVPIMGTVPIESSLAAALFGKTRRAVLALLFGNPDRSFYLREVVRAVAAGQGAVQRELDRLTQAGIVQRRRHGRQVFYQANPRCPVFTELRSIVTKTVGLLDVLRDALDPLRDRIVIAFVYGSAARGELEPTSDVDLLVVGDVAFAEVADRVTPIQNVIAREVNPSVFNPEEVAQRLSDGGHFLSRVTTGPKLFLIGDESELAGLAS